MCMFFFYLIFFLCCCHEEMNFNWSCTIKKNTNIDLELTAIKTKGKVRKNNNSAFLPLAIRIFLAKLWGQFTNYTESQPSLSLSFPVSGFNGRFILYRKLIYIHTAAVEPLNLCPHWNRRLPPISSSAKCVVKTHSKIYTYYMRRVRVYLKKEHIASVKTQRKTEKKYLCK